MTDYQNSYKEMIRKIDTDEGLLKEQIKLFSNAFILGMLDVNKNKK